MSFPTIPHITPSISLNRSQVINLLLASVAFEELGLAHIINSEGEKLQEFLDTRHSKCGSEPYLANIIKVNREVRRTLQTVVKSQMLLQFKLEDILELNDQTLPCLPHRPCPPVHHHPTHCCTDPNPCPPSPHCNRYHDFDENNCLQQDEYCLVPECNACNCYNKCSQNKQLW